MHISVISACYGDYEVIKPPPRQTGARVGEWVMVTDDPDLDAPGWHVIVEPRRHLHPNMAAKVPKFRPDLYVTPGCDVSVWVDASATVTPTFAGMVVDALEDPTAAWAMFPHPHRDNLLDEVAVSRTLSKYDELRLEDQVRHYHGFGMPDRMLWATGCIARRHHHHRMDTVAVGDAWLRECVRWGFQDQLSLPYVIHALAVPYPAPLGPSLFTSPHITFGPHRV